MISLTRPAMRQSPGRYQEEVFSMTHATPDGPTDFS